MNKREEHIQICLNTSNSSTLRIESLFHLMNIADNESLDTLFKVLKEDPCELVRHEAAFALGEMISDKAIEKLKQAFENDDSLVVKHECLMSLGTIGRKEDLEFIEKHIPNKLFEIGCSAKIAKSRILQEETFEDIENNLPKYIKDLSDYKQSDQNRRIQILFHFMNIATDECLNAILKCLKEDPCRVVRHEAGFVLGEIGTDKAVDYMIEGIEKEETPIVIHETLFALGTTGKEKALEFIEKYLNHENYVISESAKIAKERILKLKNPYRGPEHFKHLTT